MNNIPEHILVIINSYNTSVLKIMLYQTCKYYKNILEPEKNKILTLKEYLCDLYHPIIINLMGGIKCMLDYPELEWDPIFLGDTGYIDRVYSKHVSNKIMRGIDSWGRPYITLRIKDNDPDVINSPHYKKKQIFTCVLFQRYMDDKLCWTHSTRGGIDILPESGHFMRYGEIKHELIFKNIDNLLHNKGFIYKYNYKPPYDEEKVNNIHLY